MKNETDLNNSSTVNIKAGFAAGFIASAISSLVLAISTAAALVPEFNFILIQGALFSSAVTALSGWVAYYIIGTLIWGGLYAVIEPRLNGTKIVKGLYFGVVIWLIVMLLLMPLAGVGVFVKQYGFLAALIVLATDLVFGITTGYFYEKIRR